MNHTQIAESRVRGKSNTTYRHIYIYIYCVDGIGLFAPSWSKWRKRRRVASMSSAFASGFASRAQRPSDTIYEYILLLF